MSAGRDKPLHVCFLVRSQPYEKNLLTPFLCAQTGLVPVLVDAIEVAGLDNSLIGVEGHRNSEIMILIITMLSSVKGCKVELFGSIF